MHPPTGSQTGGPGRRRATPHVSSSTRWRLACGQWALLAGWACAPPAGRKKGGERETKSERGWWWWGRGRPCALRFPRDSHRRRHTRAASPATKTRGWRPPRAADLDASCPARTALPHRRLLSRSPGHEPRIVRCVFLRRAPQTILYLTKLLRKFGILRSI